MFMHDASESSLWYFVSVAAMRMLSQSVLVFVNLYQNIYRLTFFYVWTQTSRHIEMSRKFRLCAIYHSLFWTRLFNGLQHRFIHHYRFISWNFMRKFADFPICSLMKFFENVVKNLVSQRRTTSKWRFQAE